MKSASNGGVLKGRLQVLHIHVLLVAPLGHMAQSGTDRHESRIAVRETSHYPSAAADLPVQPLNHIVGTNASPVCTRQIAIGKCPPIPSSTFLAASFSFIEHSSSTTALVFSRAAFLLS